jgi:hypothetical protein
MSGIRPLALALLVAAAPAAAQDVRDALEAGELICEFRGGFRSNLFADLAGPPVADQMLVYESVTADAATVLASGRPGKRPVHVRAVGELVHLIERDGPSVRVTTLTECRDWRWKNGAETCVRFAARHAWHFGTHAYLGPDVARARVPSAAAVGVCEPWNVD